MKIQEIEISNYRGIDKINLKLNGKSTIFFGDNGSGKTTLLDSITVLLSRYINKVNRHESTKKIEDKDIMFGRSEARCSITIDYDNEIYTWGSKKDRKRSWTLISDLPKLSERILQNVTNEKSIPIIAYYPVNRSVLDIPIRIRKKHDFTQVASYEKALGFGANFRVFFEWYRNQEDIENELKLENKKYKEDSQLRSVRQAIYSCMPIEKIRITRRPLRMLVNKGRQTFEVSQLSDGEKCLFAMIGDLARRLSIANPHGNPLESSGIVLIDEIDLHLHPAWQRKIIPLLKLTFPRIQFIVSTHSPQILGESEDMNLFCLANKDGVITVEATDPLFGQDSNRIMTEKMGVSERDEKIKKQLDLLFVSIRKHDWENVDKIRSEIEPILGKSEPELIKADVLTRRRNLVGK